MDRELLLCPKTLYSKIVSFKNLNATENFSGTAESMLPNGSQKRPLAILGLQLSKPTAKKTGYFSDKTDFQKSSTVLGYVAHVCMFQMEIKFTIYLLILISLLEHFELLSVYNFILF
jgi:ABC-type Mn2+/Zn2+ transport system ATPase subunit